MTEPNKIEDPVHAWKNSAKLDAMSHGFTDDQANIIVGLISEYWYLAYSEGYFSGITADQRIAKNNQEKSKKSTG